MDEVRHLNEKELYICQLCRQKYRYTMQVEKIKAELKTALAGDLAAALALFLQKLDTGSPRLMEVFGQSGRFHQAGSDFTKGLILIGERDTVYNQVRFYLLELAGQLAESDLKPAAPSAAEAHAFGLAPAPSGNPLDLLLARLRIDWKNASISELHLVNCDRVTEFKTLKRALRDRSASGEEFQFYFINACPMQRPQSFAERVILEIIRNLDEEEDEAVLVRRLPGSNRIKIEDLPYDFMGLEQSKKKFAKYFEERFDFHERLEPVEEFLKACVHKIANYRYIGFIFRLDAQDWEPFFPEYFQWIMDTFSKVEEEGHLFLFFFPIYLRNLHTAPTPALLEVAKAVQALGEAENAISTVISPLTPVEKADVAEWFADIGEPDAGKVDELILLTLQRDNSAITRIGRFQEENKIDMYDVEALQEKVVTFKPSNP